MTFQSHEEEVNHEDIHLSAKHPQEVKAVQPPKSDEEQETEFHKKHRVRERPQNQKSDFWKKREIAPFNYLFSKAPQEDDELPSPRMKK